MTYLGQFQSYRDVLRYLVYFLSVLKVNLWVLIWLESCKILFNLWITRGLRRQQVSDIVSARGDGCLRDFSSTKMGVKDLMKFLKKHIPPSDDAQGILMSHSPHLATSGIVLTDLATMATDNSQGPIYFDVPSLHYLKLLDIYRDAARPTLEQKQEAVVSFIRATYPQVLFPTAVFVFDGPVTLKKQPTRYPNAY